jgi:hypothetical protein
MAMAKTKTTGKAKVPAAARTKTSRSGKRPTGERITLAILGDDTSPWDTYVVAPAPAAPLTLHLDEPPAAEPEESAAHEPNAGGSGAPVATTDEPRRRRQPRVPARAQQGAAKALCPTCSGWSRQRRSFIAKTHTDWIAYLKRYTNPAKWTPTEADIEWLVGHARAAGHEALASEPEVQQ